MFYALIFLINLQIVNAQEFTLNNYVCENSDNSIKDDNLNQTVYICTGNYAYAYHSNANCPGLGNCKGQINYTDEYNAVNNLNRKPCCRCWQNVSNNCKDDLATSGGGGGGGRGSSDGSGEAVLAILFVTASAAILSNDIYVYPTYSFYKDPNYSNNTPSKVGWCFGFRKTFEKSALEYGVSVLTYENNYNYGYNYGYNYNSIQEQKKWGFHFNYVHNIFESKMPDKFVSYAGPTINYFNEIGYGAMIGIKYKLLERLNLDFRYELTNQTNQLQIGLIFNYQRKYFWKK